ncbi:restriction endonuclease subunit S [Enterococcus durans]|uniref:restriction endonuclease subunit S n=1 Tax=Enterococcus durans TaxID=53345 RepID=UPI00188402AA|nr:restriction endonuclease subunit S [Enterococcus durans]MBE9888757.1 restriction endonuclease subunit S [Enterococcus durans]
MKLIPQIRFKGFTDDWEERKLSEIGKIVTGNTPNTSNKDYYNGDFLFVSPADIQENRYVNKTTTTLTELGFKTGRLVPKGATLFVSIGSTIGKTGQSICDVITNQQINSVISFSDYDDDFIYTSILNSSTKIKQLAATQAVPIINKNEFGKSIIKIPSLEEQQKIGAFFKQLDDIIALHQRKLDLLKETKKGFLQKMFPKNGEKVPEIRFPGFTEDWEQRKLGDYTDLITKGTTPKDKANVGEVTFVKVENISDGKINSNSRISIDEHENYLRRSKLKENDILFSIAGTLGRTAMVDKSILPANTNQALSIIRGYKFDTDFLLTSLNGKVVNDFIRKNPTIGAQPNLSLEQVGSLIIWTPSKDEQQQIGNFFRQLESTIALHQRELDLLKETKKGFLQKMF